MTMYNLCMITKTMMIGRTAHMNSGVAEAITVEKGENDKFEA